MDPILFASFLLATFFIIATPGPSVALASSQAIKYGPRAAAITVAGDALGTVVHVIIAVASLQTLVGMSELILPYLQIAGGVFILYLAYRSLTNRHDQRHSQTAPKATFFACVTNPKAIVFFVALFPSFVSPEHNIAIQSLIYGAIFIALDAASIMGYALLAMVTFRKTNRGWFRVETLSGFGLFGVGIFLMIKGYRSIPAQ
jgi:threonine/homoserine/homoserine lactone efflux protein